MTTIKEPVRPEDKPQQQRSVLINFVLDKSGSMDPLCDATISGFNEFKNDQAREEGEAFMTLTMFDTRFDTICQSVPVREVPDLTRESYRPNGGTALYDAIAHTMSLTDEFVVLNKPDQVIFVIMTDGEENASREFDRARIFQMISDRQEHAQYEFIYLGANQDSFIAGRDMGLRDGRMMTWAADEEGARDSMKRASHNVRAHRRHGTKQQASFFNPEKEKLGAIDSAQWSEMPQDARRAMLNQDAEAGTASEG